MTTGAIIRHSPLSGIEMRGEIPRHIRRALPSATARAINVKWNYFPLFDYSANKSRGRNMGFYFYCIGRKFHMWSDEKKKTEERRNLQISNERLPLWHYPTFAVSSPSTNTMKHAVRRAIWLSSRGRISSLHDSIINYIQAIISEQVSLRTQ